MTAVPSALLVSASLLVLGCSSPPAGKPMPAAVEASQTQEPPFDPPRPAEDGFDWIHLKSGEWLKGDLIVLRKDSLDFESDELGQLSLDWGDVAELRSSRQNTVRLKTGEVLVGTALVSGEEVVVGAVDGLRSFPRGALYTLLPGRPSERNFWSGKWSLGGSARSGNTDQLDLNTYLSLTRRTAKDRFLFSFNGNFSETNDVETANNQRLDTSYRIFVSERFYLTPASLNATRDPFQNLALRAVPSVGAGYVAIDEGDLEWNLGAGVGWLYTAYESVPAGEDEDSSDTALLFDTSATHDLTEDVELGFLYSLQVELDRDVELNHHAELRLSVDLIGELNLDAALIWDRIGDPALDGAGDLPKNDDYRVTLGLGWSF